MKIKLTQSGFETYTGQMGVIFFENGTSVGDVAAKDGYRMAAVMLCEWEDGTSPSVTQSILDNADTPAPLFLTGDEGQHDANNSDEVLKNADDSQAKAFTAEDLGAIADTSGIKGLRAIADPLNIKANSIKELIEAILIAGVKAN